MESTGSTISSTSISDQSNVIKRQSSSLCTSSSTSPGSSLPSQGGQSSITAGALQGNAEVRTVPSGPGPPGYGPARPCCCQSQKGAPPEQQHRPEHGTGPNRGSTQVTPPGSGWYSRLSGLWSSMVSTLRSATSAKQDGHLSQSCSSQRVKATSITSPKSPNPAIMTTSTSSSEMSDVFIYWTETKTQVAASVKNEPLYYNLIHEAPCEGFPDLIETHNETHVDTQTNVGATAEKSATLKKTVETQTASAKVKRDSKAHAVIKETRVVKEFRLVEGHVPFTDDDDLFSRLDRWERIYLSQVMMNIVLLFCYVMSISGEFH